MSKAKSKLPDADDRKAPEESDERRRWKADLDAATRPASGASVSAAFAGAGLAAEEEDSETEAVLKKAAQNDDGGHG